MQRLRVLIAAGIALIGPAGCWPAARAQEPPARVEPGGRFRPMKVRALTGDDATPRDIDLGARLGVRPVVVCYFMIGEPFGEEGVLSLQELAGGELKGKVDFFAATRVGARTTTAQIAERRSLLGLTLPVIVEEGFDLGAALGATSAPSIALIDGKGVIRIADAKSLKQDVAPGTTLAQAIRAAAAGGTVPTVEKLPRYYPANELAGAPSPDFILKRFRGAERIQLSEAIARNAKERKVTLLLFWHPNCKHCKVVMPSILAGAAANAKKLDIVSVTALKDADEARNADDTVRAHKMTFPVLEDEGRRISELFKVVSTPTLFFIRPDGVVDSVYTSGNADYAPVISAKVRSILGGS